LNAIHLFAGQALPSSEEFDLLAVMGGPMSVHDERDYPWLASEKKLIAQCLDNDKFVLGVCLGSQLLAERLGSRVYRNRVKEIGWLPVRLCPEATKSPYFTGMPAQMHVFHWHGETYDLPSGCVHLAASEGCRIQAFEHPSALGLQFHLETTPEGIQELIRNCGHEIGAGPYEQSPDGMLAGRSLHGEAARSALFRVLDRIEEKIGRAPRASV
jgi:GMP synthase (glutamine-hydrolysing)